MRLMEREDFRMKENKMSRRSFLKVGAFASAAGMLAAAPAAANAAAPNAANAAEEENGLLGVFGGKPKLCLPLHRRRHGHGPDTVRPIL